MMVVTVAAQSRYTLQRNCQKSNRIIRLFKCFSNSVQ